MSNNSTAQSYIGAMPENPCTLSPALLEQVQAMKNGMRIYAHLLDHYLAKLFELPNELYNAFPDGFESVCLLRGICQDIVEGNNTNAQHPFFSRAAAYIRENPLDCSPELHQELYVLLLAGEYLQTILPEWLGRYGHRLENHCAPEIRTDVSVLCGEESVCKLESLVREQYSPATAAQLFTQGYHVAVSYGLANKECMSQLLDQLQTEKHSR